MIPGVGRTVPAFKMAAETERTKWKQFRSLLFLPDSFFTLSRLLYQCVSRDIFHASYLQSCPFDMIVLGMPK
jgi:hypothetical protein